MNKQNKCEICNRNYSSLANLIRHRRELHSTNPVRHFCPLCNFATLRKGSLKIHVSKVHQMDIKDVKSKCEPIADLTPKKPLPFNPPFEASHSSKTKRRDDYNPSDKTLLNYLRTPDLVNLTPDEIPKEFQAESSPPTPTKDEPLPSFPVKIVKTTSFSYVIKRTPWLKSKHCTLPNKVPNYVVQFNKHIE